MKGRNVKVGTPVKIKRGVRRNHLNHREGVVKAVSASGVLTFADVVFPNGHSNWFYAHELKKAKTR